MVVACSLPQSVRLMMGLKTAKSNGEREDPREDEWQTLDNDRNTRLERLSTDGPMSTPPSREGEAMSPFADDLKAILVQGFKQGRWDRDVCTEISFILRSRFGEVCSCCS